MLGVGEYNQLPSDDSQNEEEKLSNLNAKYLSGRHEFRNWMILLLVLVSNFITWLLTFISFWSPHSNLSSHTYKISDASHNVRDVVTTFNYESPFFAEPDGDMESVVEAWKSINVDNGVIAISESEIRELGLPPGDLFYWDTTKRVYIVEGYHGLHCTKALFFSIHEYNNNLPQSYSHRHILHCLDTLRQTILCDADDSPRWGKQHGDPSSGFNQTRLCRSWDRLDDWAEKHSACHKMQDREGVDPELRVLSRMTWCPDDRYKSQIEKVFGRSFPS